MLDKEDEEGVVNDHFNEFQEIYKPIWESTFKDCARLNNNRLEIEHDTATRKYLMSQLNDNVFQNIDKNISVKFYDKDIKYHKSELSQNKKAIIAAEILEEHKEPEQ